MPRCPSSPGWRWRWRTSKAWTRTETALALGRSAAEVARARDAAMADLDQAARRARAAAHLEVTLDAASPADLGAAEAAGDGPAPIGRRCEALGHRLDLATPALGAHEPVAELPTTRARPEAPPPAGRGRVGAGARPRRGSRGAGGHRPAHDGPVHRSHRVAASSLCRTSAASPPSIPASPSRPGAAWRARRRPRGRLGRRADLAGQHPPALRRSPDGRVMVLGWGPSATPAGAAAGAWRPRPARRSSRCRRRRRSLAARRAGAWTGGRRCSSSRRRAWPPPRCPAPLLRPGRRAVAHLPHRRRHRRRAVTDVLGSAFPPAGPGRGLRRPPLTTTTRRPASPPSNCLQLLGVPVGRGRVRRDRRSDRRCDRPGGTVGRGRSAASTGGSDPRRSPSPASDGRSSTATSRARHTGCRPDGCSRPPRSAARPVATTTWAGGHLTVEPPGASRRRRAPQLVVKGPDGSRHVRRRRAGAAAMQLVMTSTRRHVAGTPHRRPPTPECSPPRRRFPGSRSCSGPSTPRGRPCRW